ncbi:related to host-specific AK-toxin Akt2 [Ramularia collo-cygni]|uniref:Related to host-specific AK-toxin Akt2 n=1 Tax=Ramularia collo-cygni TaxID=112498 RepID=A0A2D3VFS6_9PEZI|nr:related to host-specific AK-toxin Akt2 [Ramularia collo-cygni]CZT20709.1 related to host-specific AK-toxin Akt2 [Ramularia collo-cygni]
MSTDKNSSCFHIKTHITRTQHSRSRYAGTSPNQENNLKLCVKQYTPKNNPNPQDGDVTIIGAVADSYPKEIYEPMWEHLVKELERKGKKIRSLWVADPFNQGESGVLNEKVLGPDPSWFDHGRDLMFVINQFQDEMPHPIVGIGHSMGASHLAHLALLHPRLMHALVIIDPVFQLQGGGQTWARASTFRRDHWPSRKIAEEKLSANPGLKSWDPVVLKKFLEFGLRDCPTEMYPEVPSKGDVPVTLQSTVAQEVYNYIEPTYHDPRLLVPKHLEGREFHPDDVAKASGANFMRAEMAILWRRLEELQPSVMYIFGNTSTVSGEEARKAKIERTGRGVGGNGGVDTDMVKEVVLSCGHLVPLEMPKDTAVSCAEFVDAEVARWVDEETERRVIWNGLSREGQVGLNDLWKEKIGGPAKKPAKEKSETKL